MGFSAGGSLACSLMGLKESGTSDDVGSEPFYPNFLVLLYGFSPFCGTPEMMKNFPPALLLGAKDDPCNPVAGGRLLVRKLERAGSKRVVLHAFPEGKHGWGNCSYYPQLSGLDVCAWKTSFLTPFLNTYVLPESEQISSSPSEQ